MIRPGQHFAESIHITQRVAFNYYTAKRMLRALQMAVSRHEDTFGRVQMDVRKRVAEQSDAGQKGQVPPADDT